MQVWILMRGEANEGGDVYGVFATRELGFHAFVEQVQNISGPYGGRGHVYEEPNGAVFMEAGCERLSLEPYEVTTTAAVSC